MSKVFVCELCEHFCPFDLYSALIITLNKSFGKCEMNCHFLNFPFIEGEKSFVFQSSSDFELILQLAQRALYQCGCNYRDD